ncbi:hypothetical protein [Rhodococcus triatomae]
MATAATNAGVGGTSARDREVDHLLAEPRAGVVIVIALVLGSTILIGVLTWSALAVLVVVVGAAGVALMLSGLDHVGQGVGRDRPHHG